MAAPMITICEDDKEVRETLCDLIVQKANTAVEARGIFTVGLSGGSLVNYLCDGLPSRNIDWTKWRVFFCDERHVPHTSPDCTYTLYKNCLVDKEKLLPIENIYPINPDVTVEEAANEYTDKIRHIFPEPDLPRFDLLLLGMGPDGHTCSLFPGHPLLQEVNKVIAPISDSPKPPPSRVTMTLPVVNNCCCAIFASCGSGKADVVQRILEGNEADPLPAARVRPTEGELIWLLDKAAASKLKSQGQETKQKL